MTLVFWSFLCKDDICNPQNFKWNLIANWPCAGIGNDQQLPARGGGGRRSGLWIAHRPLTSCSGRSGGKSKTTFESVVTFVKKTITFSGLGWVARVWWLFPLQQPLQTDIFYRYWPTIHSLIHFKGIISQDDFFLSLTMISKYLMY